MGERGVSNEPVPGERAVGEPDSGPAVSVAANTRRSIVRRFPYVEEKVFYMVHFLLGLCVRLAPGTPERCP
jgi:hypothetical protein